MQTSPKPGKEGGLLALSLLLILAGGMGAHWLKTAGGSVMVTGLKFPAENGQWIAADLFRPVAATAKDPQPVVVVCPGFERSKETLDSYSIELARRGMVVITIDPYAQGASSASLERRSTTVEGNGLVAVLQYVLNTPNLNYVDRAKVGLAGYSAGGNAVLQTASRMSGGRKKKGGKKGGDAPAQPADRIAAVFAGGYVLTMTDDVLTPIRANLGMDYAYFDEGSYRTELGNPRMHNAPEALRLVNTIQGDHPLAEIEIGKWYGTREDHTLRVVYNTRNIHPLVPYDREHVANLVRFFTTSFDLKPGLAPTSQIWQFKEFFVLLALIGGLLFPVPFAALLLRMPLFAGVARPAPPPLPAAGPRGKAIFWIAFAISALVACFIFIPLARATVVLFPAASSRIPTWFFPERINNTILLWAAVNGLFGLALFWLIYRLHGRKNGVTPAMLGLRIRARELARTLGLAAAVLAGFYSLLFASYAVFHTDFRFLFVSAQASFPSGIALVALEYLLPIGIFYLANSIRVNASIRFEGRKPWLIMLIHALGNSVGLMLILAIQYTCFFSTGTVFWKEEWLYVNLLFGVIPMMFVLPYYHRYFFRITGNIYLGPLITCPIFVMMMLTSNVCYMPPG